MILAQRCTRNWHRRHLKGGLPKLNLAPDIALQKLQSFFKRRWRRVCGTNRLLFEVPSHAWHADYLRGSKHMLSEGHTSGKDFFESKAYIHYKRGPDDIFVMRRSLFCMKDGKVVRRDNLLGDLTPQYARMVCQLLSCTTASEASFIYARMGCVTPLEGNLQMALSLAQKYAVVVVGPGGRALWGRSLHAPVARLGN